MLSASLRFSVFDSPCLRTPLRYNALVISRRGFTLLEIVVALVVFVIAVTSIMAIFTLAATSHREGVTTAQTRLIGRKILAQVHAEDLGPTAPKNKQGVVWPEHDGAFTYDVTYRPVAVSAEGIAYAYHVTVTVHLPGEKARDEVFEAVLLRRATP